MDFLDIYTVVSGHLQHEALHVILVLKYMLVVNVLSPMQHFKLLLQIITE